MLPASSFRFTFSLVLVAVSSFGCNKADDKATVAISPAAQAEADQKWTTLCSTCHGQNGDGTGSAAAALNPKPRDFNSPEWQKSVDDKHITRIIVEGGMAVGKSPLMPPNPDLKDKPEVVAALVNKVRSFRK